MGSTKPPPPPPPRSTLRALLSTLFPTSADFDAFCIDFFPNTYGRFSDGMDRTAKLNLFIQLEESTLTVKSLRQHFFNEPRKLESITSRLMAINSEDKQPAAVRSQQIKKLTLARENRRLRGEDTSEIDAQLVAVKREQRQFPQLQVGEELSERYELLEVIGKGGFGRVWQAFDTIDKRIVAVKVLHAEHSDEPRRIERFIRGARQMKGLSHPHIARVLDGPSQHRGFHYFVMDYYPGGDLYRAIVEERIGREFAIRAIIDIGSALSYAHSCRIIHRDVKPENILLDMSWKPYLTDFDLVWAADTTGGTHTGFLGTYVYAPPEQLEDAQSVDERCDVYSLAMTTLFVAYGKPLTHKVIRRLPQFIGELVAPHHLKVILQRATEEELGRRIFSIDEFCRLLSQPDLIASIDTTKPPRKYILRFLSGRYSGGEYPISDKNNVIIGKSPAVDLVLLEDMISRRHAALTMTDGTVTIVDLDSTNGTYVNGERIKKAKLNSNDRILIGTNLIKFVEEGSE